MNKTFVIVIGVLTAVLVILLFNQVRLAQRVDKAIAGMPSQPEVQANAVTPATDSNLQNVQSQWALIEQKLAETSQRLDALENRSPAPQALPPRSRMRPVQPIMPRTDFLPPP